MHRVTGALRARLIAAFAVSVPFVLSACTGDGGDGEGFISFTLDGTPHTYTVIPGGSYVTLAGFTAVSANTFEASPNGSIALTIPGQTTGTFDGASPAYISYTDDAGDPFYSDYVGGSCSITVSTYGPVGGRIVGTFFGAVSDGVSTVYTITDGSFDVPRESDR